MSRKPITPLFKPYVMNQVQLLPPSLDELVEPDHLVRVIDQIVEKLDLRTLMAQYKGGGAPSYHPKMMLKVLLFAYCKKIYTSRQIAQALRENIYFMWISGSNKPDFRTLNAFRSGRMKAVTEDIFAELLHYLVDAGYVKLEHYFVDGTKIEADANKHKVVYAKSTQKRKQRVQAQIQELLQQIDQANEAEQAEYGDKDLEERGGGEGTGELNAEQLKERIEELNQRLREQNAPKTETRTQRKALKKLEKDCLPRLEKYERQTEILAGRSNYATTDPDANCMRMKEDRGAQQPCPRPAYNVQVGTENQFIVGFSLHQRAGDTGCLVPHLKRVQQSLNGRLPRQIVADAAYGSEENYAYLEQQQVENFLKYNTFYQDTHAYRDPERVRAHQFRAENFRYNQETDTFFCPADKPLHYETTTHFTTDNGFPTERRIYACQDCAGCPFKSRCTQAEKRKIKISFRLLEYRRKARENLTSEQGKQLRAARSTEVESVFGHIKRNLGFRRFHLRGLEKVKTEWGLVSIAHNLLKYRNMAAQ